MNQEYILENESLKASFSSHGAELRSLVNKNNGQEYMWQADPKFWARTSPVLFPIVGSLANGSYLYKGIEFPMSQHGFARDLDFAVESQTENEIWFALCSNEETRNKYPFDFLLEIGYCLENNQLSVNWNVTNKDNKTMYYSIGAHPAFNCPINSWDEKKNYRVQITGSHSSLQYHLLNQCGLRMSPAHTLALNETMNFPITAHMFDDDALIFEDNQIDSMALVTPDGTPYVTVSSKCAKLFGLWSPAGKNAPFVCIEPWFGRCDGEDFQGELRNREHGNILEPGASQNYHYDIRIN